MALIKVPMSAAIQATYAKFNPISIITATEVTTAIITYWSTGLHPTGGVVIAIGSTPLLLAGLIKAWAPFQPSTDIVAGNVADAIDKALLSVIIAGGLFGVGGVKSANKELIEECWAMGFALSSTSSR